MCQLLGISANRPVDVRFSFREWRHRGDRNPHGYGFAHWDDGRLEIVKAASNLFDARTSETEDILAARSGVFLAHVRFASVGVQDGNNTHPFAAEALGRSFAFAHNGTLRGVERLPIERTPEGQTDSEHAFLWILEQLAGSSADDLAPRTQTLADHLHTLGTFNMLLSDGQTLWAYADSSLWLIERRPPHGGRLVTLQTDGYAMDLEQVKAPDERATIIATRPLTDEPGWRRLRPGELAVIRDGIVDSTGLDPGGVARKHAHHGW